jgi:hypothetical protein
LFTPFVLISTTTAFRFQFLSENDRAVSAVALNGEFIIAEAE